MASSTASVRPSVWVGDEWTDDTDHDHLLRVTMVDVDLDVIEAQDEAGTLIVSGTISAFIERHHQLRRSPLATEHGW